MRRMISGMLMMIQQWQELSVSQALSQPHFSWLWWDELTLFHIQCTDLFDGLIALPSTSWTGVALEWLRQLEVWLRAVQSVDRLNGQVSMARPPLPRAWQSLYRMLH